MPLQTSVTNDVACKLLPIYLMFSLGTHLDNINLDENRLCSAVTFLILEPF